MGTALAPIETNQPKSRRGGRRPGAGRPKGRTDLAGFRQLKDIEERAREHSDTALAALVAVAEQDESYAARVAAATALLDRGYGRPKQAVELSSDPDRPIVLALEWRFGDRVVKF